MPLNTERVLHEKMDPILDVSSVPSLHVTSDLPCLEDKDTDRIPQPHYAPDDIARVQAMLTHFVPVELADAILDMAEFWPWIAVSRNSYTSAYSALEAPDSNAQWCYLVTPKIPSVERNGRRVSTTVRMVRFFVKTYGSSWGGGGNESGSSQTWFESAILKPTDPESVSYEDSIHPRDWFDGLAAPHPKFLNDFRDADFPGTPVSNPFDAKTRWHVTNNALNTPRVWREITWRFDDKRSAVVERQSGDGQGAEFCQSLSVDDRLVLMARAKAPGWIDTIFNVKIEVYYTLDSSFL
ncbi:hypothetical protein NLJ89_g6365 [Agrocybe chaxingu]|uniref:Uncharacterized protein n=1 Tax=Agrocybe chaxingu TaxID=84603 RepID=A0A9W8MW33_9AGAR|nr:hypothetical protein NLJ89_g6365 [Agrocybe chaxingu]